MSLTPQKAHGLIVLTGFLPYFIAEALGYSVPMVGLAACDSTYEFTPAMGLILGMAGVMSGTVAYMEFTGKMDLKTFTYYHYPLSLLIAKWQMSDFSSMIGKMWFAAPHMFTLWGSMSLFGKDKK